jgi:hypothetical protein
MESGTLLVAFVTPSEKEREIIIPSGADRQTERQTPPHLTDNRINHLASHRDLCRLELLLLERSSHLEPISNQILHVIIIIAINIRRRFSEYSHVYRMLTVSLHSRLNLLLPKFVHDQNDQTVLGLYMILQCG